MTRSVSSLTGVRVRIDGQPLHAAAAPAAAVQQREQQGRGGRVGAQVHRDPGGVVRQRRDAVAGQAAHPDTAGGAGHVLRAVARHHRPPDVVQGVRPGLSHHVPVHGPHAADRAELRLRGRRGPAVVARGPAHVRPGEHPAVGAAGPVQARAPRAEAAARARARPPAARQVAHLAAVLLRAHHQRRGVGPVAVPVAAEPRAARRGRAGPRAPGRGRGRGRRRLNEGRTHAFCT